MSLKTLRPFLCHFNEKLLNLLCSKKWEARKGMTSDDPLFIGYTFLNINETIYSQYNLVVLISGGPIHRFWSTKKFMVKIQQTPFVSYFMSTRTKVFRNSGKIFWSSQKLCKFNRDDNFVYIGYINYISLPSITAFDV